MSTTHIPAGYKSVLSLYETQTCIGYIKRVFEDNLCHALNIKRVSAPLFVDPATGLNDDLNGIERPVQFDIPGASKNAAVVHSLAKWKRLALHQYGFPCGEGLCTDMNAIRRDESIDNIHSIYTDQWDWEKVISADERNIGYLKDTVVSIVNAICDTSEYLKYKYPQITVSISRDVSFVTTQELEDMYPSLTPKQRENAYLREHHTAFIMQIGDKLKSGNKHDGRAPDYDDWQLNGDLFFYDELLDIALELSSMGIRVDSNSMEEQLRKADAEDRKKYQFHRMILENKLPLTIGGGIGQSRLCMLLLQKAHIGEVQVSVWDNDTLAVCEKHGIQLL